MNRFAICSQLLLFFLYWMGAEMTVAESNESMPAPFTRVLYITTPLMKGKKRVVYFIYWLAIVLQSSSQEAKN